MKTPGRCGMAVAATMCVLLAGLAGCHRRAVLGPGVEPFDWKEPPTVEGVRWWMDEEEVRALLGEPGKRLPDGRKMVWQWRDPLDLWVTFDPHGHVIEAWGCRLAAEGRSLVQCGDSEERVRAILGRPRHADTAYSPTGPGVLAMGRKDRGRELVYRSARFRILIELRENRVVFIGFR